MWLSLKTYDSTIPNREDSHECNILWWPTSSQFCIIITYKQSRHPNFLYQIHLGWTLVLFSSRVRIVLLLKYKINLNIILNRIAVVSSLFNDLILKHNIVNRKREKWLNSWKFQVTQSGFTGSTFRDEKIPNLSIQWQCTFKKRRQDRAQKTI